MEKFRINDIGILEIRLIGNRIQFSTTPDYQEERAELSKENALKIADKLRDWAVIEVKYSCPLCRDTGFYSFGGSFGGAVQTVRCSCGAVPPVSKCLCDDLYHKHICLSSMRYRFCPHCGEPVDIQ